MNHAAELAALESLDRFTGLPEKDLKTIAKSCNLLTVPAGWALVSEQTAADKAYILLDGEVSVRQHGDEVARLGPGDLMGEMAIVEHRLRNAALVSLTPLQVLHFTREAVEELEQKVPEFRKTFEAAAAEHRGRAE